RTINPKFGHKLDFIEDMKLLKANGEANTSAILVGDLNIAPLAGTCRRIRSSQAPRFITSSSTSVSTGVWLTIFRSCLCDQTSCSSG
ncbi:hypothetical protein AB9E28_34925, partial [Rhizobium leguminosarum]